MQRRPFGTSGRTVGVVGQGTWRLERATRSDAVAALRRGLDLGMDHVDTAEMYGSGKAEELVAEAIAGRRDEVFVVTKVLPSNASRRRTLAACDRSLKRLGTDRIDCYLLHWPSDTPLQETIGAFEELRAAGKILSWGVSNFDVGDLEETIAIAGDAGPVCNQILYHLEERGIEHRVLPWCAERDVAVVAYTPFGERVFPGPRSERGRVLQEVAGAHGATPRQVALAFLLRDPSVLVIPKAGRLEHVEENAGAGDLVLTTEELERIEQAFPLGRPPRELPTA